MTEDTAVDRYRWLTPLPDAEEQRAIDQWAIEELGIPGAELMERAGAGLTELVQARAPRGRVAVVCGKGNNGGDGLVVARLLRAQGRDVLVLLLADPDQLRGDAAANLERLPGSPTVPFTPERLSDMDVVVDAILGTGFEGEARDPAAGAIEAINAAAERGAVVVACDMPSGVNASTGEVAGAAVKASATGTFHAGKPGLWIAPGKNQAGDVTVIDIGIPPGASVRPAIGLITDQVLDAVPRRGRESTKFAAGSVLVCGGSRGLTGAPSMASEAAMRAGAGYVTVLVPASRWCSNCACSRSCRWACPIRPGRCSVTGPRRSWGGPVARGRWSWDRASDGPRRRWRWSATWPGGWRSHCCWTPTASTRTPRNSTCCPAVRRRP
jgi:NAD(P)H-hydrate epimerase